MKMVCLTHWGYRCVTLPFDRTQLVSGEKNRKLVSMARVFTQMNNLSFHKQWAEDNSIISARITGHLYIKAPVEQGRLLNMQSMFRQRNPM